MRKFVFVFLLLILAGCARHNIYVDGMPIPNYEYVVNTDGLRISYIMVRYFYLYEDDEKMLYPEYLDVMDNNDKIDSNTEKLYLHVKVVNINRNPYSVFFFEGSDINANYQRIYPESKHKKYGKLSRKDFSLSLPLEGCNKFFVAFHNDSGEIFKIGESNYCMKGGDKK